jgi:mono/diheme cytochrome c family protein
MTAAVLTVASMAWLTLLGAEGGPPTEIELATAPEFESGKQVVASQGCLGCHKIGENGGTLGPDLTEVGARIPAAAIASSVVNGPGIMPSYRLQETDPEAFDEMVKYLASLDGTEIEPPDPGGG